MMYAIIVQGDGEYEFYIKNDSQYSHKLIQSFQSQGHVNGNPFLILDNTGKVIYRSLDCNISLDSDENLFIHVYGVEDIPDRYMAWCEYGGVDGDSIEQVIENAQRQNYLIGRLCTMGTSAGPKIREIHDYPRADISKRRSI